MLALVLPALRVLRPLRLLQLGQSAGIIRVVSSLNRSMRALSRAMGRRGFGYIVVLTILVCFGGAAGMYAFEKGSPAGGFNSFGDALWWTAMTITTLGSSYTPATTQGRVLMFLVALYGFSVFGYVAATMASFFVERDAASPQAETVGREDIQQILDQIAELRKEVQEVATRIQPADRTLS